MSHQAVIQGHVEVILAALRGIKAAAVNVPNGAKVRKSAASAVASIEELAHVVYINEKNAARSFPSPTFP